MKMEKIKPLEKPPEPFSLEKTLTRFVAFSKEILKADAVCVFIYDSLHEILIARKEDGFSQSLNETRIRVGEGMAGWAARERAPVVQNEIGNDPRFQLPSDLKEVRAAACFPLLFQGNLLGVLLAARFSSSPFSSESVKGMQPPIDEIAPYLHDALKFLQIEERLNELSALMRIINIASASHQDSKKFIEKISRELPSLLGADKAKIWLFSDGMTESFCQLISEKGNLKGCFAMEHRLPLIENEQKTSNWKYVRKASGSVCCIPLLGQSPLGMILAESIRSNAFREEKVEFYTTVANQIAQALERIQTIENLNSRVRELSTLYEVAAYELSAVLSSTSNLDEALHLTTEIVAKLLNTERVSIMLLDEEKKELYLKTSRGPGPFSLKRMKIGEGIAGYVMKTGKPYVAADSRKDSHYIPWPNKEEETESLACVPLMVEGRKIGIINAGTILKKREFSEDDLKTLTLIASRAALAIENALLHQRERETAQELLKKNRALEDQSRELERKSKLLRENHQKLQETLNEIQKQTERMKFLYDFNIALSKSLDMEEVLQTSLDKIQAMLPSPISIIAVHQIEGEMRKIRLVASRGLDSDLSQRYEIPLMGSGHARLNTILEKKPVLVHNVMEQKDLKKLIGRKIQSLYSFPLISKGRVLGVLTLAASVPHALGKTEADLFLNISSQIAMAFENARLYRESHEYARQLGDLNALVAEVGYYMEFRERVGHLVKTAAELLEHKFCLLALMNERGQFVLNASFGFPGVRQGQVLFFREDIMKKLQHGEVLAFPSIEQKEDAVPWLDEGAVILAPLHLKERVFGILALGKDSPANYTFGEIDFVRLLANRAALIVENASLYNEAVLEKNKLEMIVHQMGDGVITLDIEGHITTFNEAAESITGIRADDVLGLSCEEVFVENEQRWNIFLPETPPPPDRETFKEEYVVAARGGEERYLRSVYSFVKSQDGKPLGWVVIVHDITEQKKQEQIKNDFLSIVSHDLRTPLTAIKGYAATLLRFEDKLTPELKRESLGAINSEMDRFARMLDNLLDLSRIEAGKLNINVMTFNVREIAYKVAEMFKISSQNHRFVLHFPEKFPNANGDQDQVEQVLNNLVSNAIKYSPTGGVVEIKGSVKNGAIIVSVADQGMGIPGDQLEKIFERYHRVNSKNARLVSGTGLGLFISKNLIEAQGGKLWVKSQVGKGSTFSFSLPLGDANGSKGEE